MIQREKHTNAYCTIHVDEISNPNNNSVALT